MQPKPKPPSAPPPPRLLAKVGQRVPHLLAKVERDADEGSSGAEDEKTPWSGMAMPNPSSKEWTRAGQSKRPRAIGPRAEVIGMTAAKPGPEAIKKKPSRWNWIGEPLQPKSPGSPPPQRLLQRAPPPPLPPAPVAPDAAAAAAPTPTPGDERSPVEDAYVERPPSRGRAPVDSPHREGRFSLFARAQAYARARAGAAALRADADVARTIALARSRSPDPSPARSRSRSSADETGVDEDGVDETGADETGNQQGLAIGWSVRECRRPFYEEPVFKGLGLDDEGPFFEGEDDNMRILTDICMCVLPWMEKA